MKFNEFIKDVEEKGGVDTDGYYGKQCMDLYNYYGNNVLGINDVGADCAKNILNNKNIMENVERIDNYPEFVPQKGDIAVFTGLNYGHVAICLGEGDVNSFKTIEQNWKPQQLTEEWHDYIYGGPIVFLRPKNQENLVEPAKPMLTLPGNEPTWRVYPLGVAPVVGNECGQLLPSKFGGLKYEILEWSQENVAIIQTRDFGKVQIYVGKDTSAIIK